MSDSRAKQDREFEGEWWAPETSNVRMSGTLREADGILTLSIRERGISPAHLTRSVLPNIALLHGIAGNKPISLINCDRLGQRIGGNPSVGYEAVRTYSVQAAILGAHTVSPDPSLRVAHVSFAHLEEWLDQTPFSIRFSKRPATSYAVKFHCPRPKLYKVHSIGARIGFAYSWYVQDLVVLRNPGLFAEAWSTIEPFQPQVASWFNDAFWQLRLLLTIVLGVPVSVRGISGQLADLPPAVEGPKVEIMYSEYRSDSVMHVGQRDIPLTRPELGRQWPKILRNWFRDIGKRRVATELFVSTLSNMRMFPHQRFSLTVQALETLHRKTRSGKYVSPNAFRSVAESLMAAYPKRTNPDLKLAVKGKLDYANEYSLRKRLKDLTEKLDPEVRQYISTKPAVLIDKVVATRNYFVHWDDKSALNRVSDAELPYVTHALRQLYIATLLGDLGLSKEKILAAIVT